MIRMVKNFIFSPQAFRPKELVSSFTDLLPLAKANPPKLIIFDKDDTITQLHHFTAATQSISLTLQALRSLNISLMILSNSIKPHDPTSVQGIPIMRTEKKKPWNESQVRKELTGMGLGARGEFGSDVWIVGDRLMTDIYLANRIRCKGILVPPVEPTTKSKHGWIVWMLRRVENVFLSIHGWK